MSIKRCILIESLVKKEIPIGDYYEINHCGAPMPILDEGGVKFTAENITFDVEIVPINRVCDSQRDDVYIAYSKEVEELIGVPVKAIVEQNKNAHKDIQKIKDTKNKEIENLKMALIGIFIVASQSLVMYFLFSN